MRRIVSTAPIAPSTARPSSTTRERDAAFKRLRQALERAEHQMEAVQAELASIREAAEGAQASSLMELALSVPRAAQLLGVSKTTLYRLLAKQEIRAVHIERATRIPLRELEAYLEAKLAESVP